MPIYTYKCEDCGQREDRVVSVKNRDVKRPCAICDGEVNRVIAVPGYVWGPTRNQ